MKVGNPYQKLILVSLADIANESRQCWPSHQYLADRAECHRATVIRHIAALEGAGLIRITKRVDSAGLKSSNIYTLPDVAESNIDVAHSNKGSSTARHNTPIDTPTVINREAWSEWIEYRKQAKKKMTEATVKKQHAMLSRFSKDVQQEIIDSSIQNGWTGLFEPKERNNASPRPNGDPATSGRKLTPAERTAAKREQLRRSQSPDLGAMAEDGRDVRPHLGLSAR